MPKKTTKDSVIAICIQELYEDGSSMDLGSITGDDLRFLHQAFITDTIRNALVVPDTDIRLYYIGHDERKKLVSIVSDYLAKKCSDSTETDFKRRFSSHQMEKERWGVRIETVFEECFAQGYRNVFVLGSRTPTISSTMMERAIRMLRESDAVFGPTPEGRYYGVGMAGYYQIKLSDFDWKSPSIYSEVASTFDEKDLSWTELEIWYAVEQADDLETMVRDINQYRFEGDELTAHETEKVIERIIAKMEM